MRKLFAALLLSVRVSAATFVWDAADKADYYLLYESTDNGWSYVTVGATTKTSISYISPFPEAMYRVTTNNIDTGESEPSNVIDATTLQILGIDRSGDLNILWFGTTPGAVLQESTDLVNWTPTVWPIDTRSAAQKFFRLKP